MATRSNAKTATIVKKEIKPQTEEAALGEEPELSPEQLLEIYTLLLKCQMVDERSRILFRQGKFKGNFYSGRGQEATHVGTLYGCRKSDWVGPSHRDMLAAVVKGAPVRSLIAQLYACVDSPDRGKTTPAHFGHKDWNIITPASTIAAQWQLATGVALGLKMQGKDDICFAFGGDGATSTGAWHEATNFAGVHKLGIVYVIQNNFWAESVPVRLQTAAKDLADKAVGYGMPGVVVDGMDVLAVYRVAQEAIRRARAGEGPTLIECKCYRWYGHSEIDPAKYRPREEVQEWKKRDPVLLFAQRLKEENILTAERKQRIEADIKKEIDEAVEAAEKSDSPPPEEALEHLYAPEPE